MKKKEQMAVEKNDEFILEITGMTGEGQGIGRRNGLVVFVTEALLGEEIKVHVIKVTSSYAVAKPVEIFKTSSARITPRCPVYRQCGGCTLQHMNYKEQLKLKRQQVIDALERVGGILNPIVEEPVGMENPWRYRNKGAFPYGKSPEGISAFGFYAERSHRLIPISDCMIQDERTIEIARKVEAWAEENGIEFYDEKTGRGYLRHVMARVTTEGESMAVVVTKGKLKAGEQLAEALSGVDSVYHNQNDAKTNVIFGKTYSVISGKTTIRERICGHLFQIGPESFLQVNPIQTEKLYRIAVDMARMGKTGTALDLYCGIGTITLLLAKTFDHVIGVEIINSAVEDARKNARDNGVSNVEFLSGDTAKILPDLLKMRIFPDVVLLDPPRKGCEETVLSTLVRNEIKRIVYISCNPATLARDIAFLKRYDYELIKAVPVDMFANTSHIETVVLMSRIQD